VSFLPGVSRSSALGGVTASSFSAVSDFLGFCREEVSLDCGASRIKDGSGGAQRDDLGVPSPWCPFATEEGFLSWSETLSLERDSGC